MRSDRLPQKRNKVPFLKDSDSVYSKLSQQYSSEDRNDNQMVRNFYKKETGIQNINLYSLVDYIILICCLLKRVDFKNLMVPAPLWSWK